MRIGVNLLFLVPGEVGGSEPLLTNLVRVLAGSDHEITVFGVRGFAAAYPDISSHTDVVEVGWSTGAQLLRILAEHTWLAREIRRRRLDVIHHGVGTTPFVKVAPTVVTIHDIQIRHYPQNFVRPKRLWLKVNVPYSARRSEVVTVPSEWVKQDLVGAFDLDPEKIAVVPFGSEHLFGDAPATPELVRERYRLERPYFYFPGRTYPHKNHRFLIEAFSPLSGDADLVLTGAPWFRDAEIDSAIRHLGLRGKVRRIGHVPRADLAGLYRGAVALAYPSRFEGFGAPVMEAMSVGCPVVSSNVAALPEVVGDAGILLAPLDAEAWTETLGRVLREKGLRETLFTKGLERAAKFTWARSADLQLAAYKRAIG